MAARWPELCCGLMASNEDDGGAVWGKLGKAVLATGLGAGVVYGIKRLLEPRPLAPTPPRPPVRESQIDLDLEVKRAPKPRPAAAPKERRARAPHRGPVFIPEPVEPEPVEVERWMTDWADELAEKIKAADRKRRS